MTININLPSHDPENGEMPTEVHAKDAVAHAYLAADVAASCLYEAIPLLGEHGEEVDEARRYFVLALDTLDFLVRPLRLHGRIDELRLAYLDAGG